MESEARVAARAAVADGGRRGAVRQPARPRAQARPRRAAGGQPPRPDLGRTSPTRSGTTGAGSSRNRVNDLAEIEQILELTDEEREGLSAPDKFRVDVTPYFISLIDPKDPNDPIRRQIIPLGRELHGLHRDDGGQPRRGPPLARPGPRPPLPGPRPDADHDAVRELLPLLHPEPDRRRPDPELQPPRARGAARLHPPDAPDPRRADLRRRRPDARPEAARVGDPRPARDPPRRDHPDRLARAGVPAAADRRGAVRDARQVPPAVDEHPLQPPQRDHARARARLRQAEPRRHPAGQPVGAARRASTTASTSSASSSSGWSRSGSGPTTSTSATWSRAPATSGRRSARASRSSRACAATPAGYAVPQFIVDAPGGGGKIPVMPNYLVSYSDHKVVLRNYEGYITTYEEPPTYTPHDKAALPVLPEPAPRAGPGGHHGLLDGKRMWIEPQGLRGGPQARQRRAAPAQGPGQVGAVRRRGDRGPAVGRHAAAGARGRASRRRRRTAPAASRRSRSTARARSPGRPRACRPPRRTTSCSRHPDLAPPRLAQRLGLAMLFGLDDVATVSPARTAGATATGGA